MQSRKKEFLELFRLSGWTQAEAARKLDMTRGGMHGIVQGDTIPSIPTVRLFRLVIKGEKPHLKLPEPITENIGVNEERAQPDDWSTGFVTEMNELTEQDRNNVLEGCRAFLRSIPRRVRSQKKAA